MQMPEGTVFCKFPMTEEAPRYMCLGIGTPCILDGTSEADFYSTDLGESMAPEHGDCAMTLLDMREHLGKEVPFEHAGGRDGFFEGDEVGFAIFSRQEVEEMIHLLQEALENGYKR